MKKAAYYTLDDVLHSPWAKLLSQPEAQAPQTDRVLRSTKLEDSIYTDLRSGDSSLEMMEQIASEKLPSFPALSRDVFQSFYSLLPRRTDAEQLTAAARKFNMPILEHVVQSEDFPSLKAVCEGRELPAYEAAAEFTGRLFEDLDQLLRDLCGEKGAVNTLSRLEHAQKEAAEKLASVLKELQQAGTDTGSLEQLAVSAANTAESKRRQTEAVGKLIDAAAAHNDPGISEMVASSIRHAAEKAQETSEILASWSDEPGNMGCTPANADLLKRVRSSGELLQISRSLGRFREILARARHNGYAYGRGETYTLELGNNLSRALTSELALLAAPETIPLFLRKYQQRQIKQYRRREPIRQGMGDIICCLDESYSTKGEAAAWGKAVALTLLDIASESGRRFALIHFSGADCFQTDLFLPGAYSIEDKLQVAEVFLDGGTNFATPIAEALRLMEEEGFERADIVMITDGECIMPDEMLERLQKEQAARRFTVTGILLDTSTPGMAFSLEPFCEKVYRTSELVGDQIVQQILTSRV